MRIANLTLIALVVTWVCVPALAQRADDDARKARKAAWDKVEADLKNHKLPVMDAVTSVETLQDVLDHDMALKLLAYFDECDNAWTSNRKDKLGRSVPGTRHVESYKIAKAILKVVRNMKSPEEAMKFVPMLTQKDKFTLRVRTVMLDAIAGHFGNEACATFVLTLARDSAADSDLRVLSLDHVGRNAKSSGVLEVLLATLRDRSWRVRDASVAALVSAADTANTDRITLALINRLAEEEGKLCKVIADALERINGVRIGTDPDAWIEWYKNKKRSDEGLPPRAGTPNRGTRTRVFETDSFSDRYVFVIDTSISMLKRITEEEKERLRRSITGTPGEEKDKRRPLDWSQIHTKLDLAREEIIRSLEVMDPKKTRFTMISFSVEAANWKEELVPTDEKNVVEAAAWLRAIKGGKETNVFGAINAALDLSEKLAGIDVEKRKGRKAAEGKVITGPHADEALPDTIFLYTDGWATNGKYAGNDKAWQGMTPMEKGKLYEAIMKYMLDEVEDRNRVSRITFNTVGVGNPQDRPNLSALARRCGGQYVAIGDK